MNRLQAKFQNNIFKLSEYEYKKEFERLAIDLSWKSSQIEGNTYSLLETERLLKEKQTATGKTKDEASMLLNHKDALDFIIEHPDYLYPLTVSKIDDIHSILTKELAVERNLRKRRVGISGTNSAGRYSSETIFLPSESGITAFRKLFKRWGCSPNTFLKVRSFFGSR